MNTFFVVFQFDATVMDFVIRGIYSKREDAEAHNATLTPKLSHAVVEHTFEHIVEELTRLRLGALADALLGREREVPEYRCLYADSFPVAVAKTS